MYQIIKDGTTIGIDETDIKDIVQSRLNNKKETEFYLMVYLKFLHLMKKLLIQ
jgi:hypothetical protein